MRVWKLQSEGASIPGLDSSSYQFVGDGTTEAAKNVQ